MLKDDTIGAFSLHRCSLEHCLCIVFIKWESPRFTLSSCYYLVAQQVKKQANIVMNPSAQKSDATHSAWLAKEVEFLEFRMRLEAAYVNTPFLVKVVRACVFGLTHTWNSEPQLMQPSEGKWTARTGGSWSASDPIVPPLFAFLTSLFTDEGHTGAQDPHFTG